MNADRLLALYETVAEAPDAIARLRRFVLDLAVRGKLVAQDPADESASELLKRIAAEKARLVRAGEIRKKAAQDPKMVEPPHELPAGWRWVSLGTVFLYDAGAKRDPKSLDPSLWLLELEDIEKETGRLLARIAVADRESKSTKSEFRPGDILYGKLRPYLTKVLVADEPGYSTTEIVAIRPFVPLCSEYCAIALRRPDFVEYVTRLGQGTKMPRLRTEDAVVSPFPLPPLAEQRRIVAKVDELMALLDELEAARSAREATRDRLTAASLARLTALDSAPAEFQDNARFALAKLPSLTTRLDQIKPLRQTILNLAVRGKLVEQDPADERSVQNALRPDTEAESYDRRAFEERASKFDLPSNWTIQPLSRVAERIVDCPHTTPKWTEKGVLCIKTNQVRAGILDLSAPTFVSEETYKIRIERLEPLPDDILYIREGGVLGVGCRIPPNARLCMGQRLMLIRANASVTPVFLELCLNSPWIADFAAEKTTGGAAPRVNMSLVRGYPIPLPPLAEQHRIVAKVDALMALCDRLEEALAAADTTRQRLLESLLHEVLSPEAARTLEAAE